MNHEFTTTSTLLRTVFAGAALAISTLVVGSIALLADHYDTNAQLAQAQQTVIVKR